MINAKFIKDPGYICDLFFIFILKFNKDYCLKNYINYNKSDEDTAFFNKVLDNFAPIPDELFPFFYITESGKCFMSEYYYEPYMEQFASTYNMNFLLQSALIDYDKVILNLIKFYFPNINEDEIKRCFDSVKIIGTMIRDSHYNDTIKSNLYSFFLDPKAIVQKLSYELMAKEIILSQQYEKNYKDIIQLEKQFEFDDFIEKYKLLKSQNINFNYPNDIYVSFGLLVKNLMKLYFNENEIIIVLGVDYDSCLEYILEKTKIIRT